MEIKFTRVFTGVLVALWLLVVVVVSYLYFVVRGWGAVGAVMVLFAVLIPMIIPIVLLGVALRVFDKSAGIKGKGLFMSGFIIGLLLSFIYAMYLILLMLAASRINLFSWGGVAVLGCAIMIAIFVGCIVGLSDISKAFMNREVKEGQQGNGDVTEY